MGIYFSFDIDRLISLLERNEFCLKLNRKHVHSIYNGNLEWEPESGIWMETKSLDAEVLLDLMKKKNAT